MRSARTSIRTFREMLFIVKVQLDAELLLGPDEYPRLFLSRVVEQEARTVAVQVLHREVE